MRPAMQFVDIANQFASKVRVLKGEMNADGKSIREMTLLAATQGTKLTIEIEGGDSEDAMQALKAIINRGFDEMPSAEAHRGAGDDTKKSA